MLSSFALLFQYALRIIVAVAESPAVVLGDAGSVVIETIKSPSTTRTSAFGCFRKRRRPFLVAGMHRATPVSTRAMVRAASTLAAGLHDFWPRGALAQYFVGLVSRSQGEVQDCGQGSSIQFKNRKHSLMIQTNSCGCRFLARSSGKASARGPACARSLCCSTRRDADTQTTDRRLRARRSLLGWRRGDRQQQRR